MREGFPVRLSGQDCERGTFSQRHAVLVDQETEEKFAALNHIGAGPGRVRSHQFHAVGGGRARLRVWLQLAEPNTLVMWEAQFGDFANGAQVVFDQFISSGERKWLRMCGLVMLLPHGYEGQGPEHSSARLERWLQLCAEDNWQVANCTTPANYFHILRRQLHRKFRKPLVLMTPKSLLRHKRVTIVASRMMGPELHIPPRALGRCAASDRTRDQARRGRQDQARRAVHGQGLLRSSRRAREARHRRRLSDAGRAALSVPGPRADSRAGTFLPGRHGLVPGGAEEHGRLELHRAQYRVGARPHRRRSSQAAALCRAAGDRPPRRRGWQASTWPSSRPFSTKR